MRRGISLGMRASCWQYWYSLLRERFSSVICRGCDGDYASCSCKLTCSTPFGTCAAMQEVKPKPSEHDLEIWTLSGPLFLAILHLSLGRQFCFSGGGFLVSCIR